MSNPVEPIAYLNGDFVRLSEARISIFDQGLVHGAGVSEMLRTFRHKFFRADLHLQRLRWSLDALGFETSHSLSELSAIIDRVVSSNCELIQPTADLGGIVFVTAGLNPTYVGPDVAAASGCSIGVHTFELPFQLWADGMQNGRHLATPESPRTPVTVIDPRIKTRSRMAFLVADRQAKAVDPKARALLLDSRGIVTETGTCNVFIVKDGVLFTPPGDLVLQGISRHVIIEELAPQIGVRCEEAEFNLDALFAADEVFTTSTPYCLMPVARVNNAPIGQQIPGPITQQLTDAWSKLVGLDIVDQICGKQ